MQVKVSVIIPFFNAAEHLEGCAASLLKQNLHGLELIFVNDCSTDRSLKVLEETIRKFSNHHIAVKIIQHKKTLGVACARNSGLLHATGLYVGWVDADDWVDENMFFDLYGRAVETKADIVWSPFFMDFKDKQYLDEQRISENKHNYMKALIRGEMQGMLWNKLFLRAVITGNQLGFLPGCNMGEDRNFLFKVLFYSRKIAREPNSFYHYVQSNPTAMTRDIRMERVYEEIANNDDIVRFIKDQKISSISKRDLNDFLANGKRRLLLSSDIADFKRWREIHPETNTLVWHIKFPLHYRILGFCASKEIWFPVICWINLKKALYRVKGGKK